MHRYVDLHYQYLTSSYACMLSCPISLRPFVILEGTGLGPWGAQGQRDGGLCHQHLCGGIHIQCIYCSLYATNTKSQDKCAKLIKDLICCPGRIFFFLQKNSPHLQFQHVSTCVKSLRGSASGFHLLGIMLWMSLCRYMFLFVSL